MSSPDTINSLRSSASCLQSYGPDEKLAFEVFYMAKELETAGGFTFDPNTLAQSAACWRWPVTWQDSINAVIAYETAVAKGATVTLSNPSDIKCLKAMDHEMLIAMRTYLRDRLRGV